MPQLNVINEDGEFHIWLDTEGFVKDGTIIGVADTKDGAIDDAISTLRQLVGELDEMKGEDD